MGFKRSLLPATRPTLQTASVEARQKGTAATVLQSVKSLIDNLNAPEGILCYLRKNLLRVIAKESVEVELASLRSARQAIEAQDSSRSIKAVANVIEQIYMIAVDKQIDVHFHQSSRCLGHIDLFDAQIKELLRKINSSQEESHVDEITEFTASISLMRKVEEEKQEIRKDTSEQVKSDYDAISYNRESLPQQREQLDTIATLEQHATSTFKVKYINE